MISIATWNIQYGRGRDDRVDLARQAELLRGYDVIGLQEVDRFWDRTGNVDQLAELTRLLPDHWHVYGAGVDVLKQLGPGPAGAMRRQFGNAVFSRLPILASRAVLLPRRALIGRSTMQRVAVETVLQLPSGRCLRFVSTHLDHAQPDLRLDQAAALLALYRDGPMSGGVEYGSRGGDRWWTEALAAPPVPQDLVLAGDFNLEPDEPPYALLAGPLDRHYGRVTHLDGLADCWTLAGHPEMEGPTWWTAADQPKRLDYILVSAGLVPLVRSCHVIHDTDASDHQPVVAVLDLD